MELLDYPPFARLRSLSPDQLDSTRFILERGHSGIRAPYSVPFRFRIEAPDGYIAWWSSLNFDQLHVKTPYGAVNLLARFCTSMLLRGRGDVGLRE